MNINCKKDELLHSLLVVSRAVSQKSSLPALEGILIRTLTDSVQLIGYDLDSGIQTIIKAEIFEKGEIVLPARMLLEMVKKMPGESIDIEIGNKFLAEIKSGDTHYTIFGMSADEFPEFPTIGNLTQVTLKQSFLKSMIEQTHFAISQNDSKPVHTGSLFEIFKHGEIKVISVDGFRLAIRTEKIKNEENIRFVIPGKTLTEISRILEDNEEEVDISISKRHAIIQIGNFKLFSRLLEGDFLDYKGALPKKYTTKIKVNVREFIDSIERASLLISDKLKSPVKIKFEDNNISISCATSLGKAEDRLNCILLEGETVEMGFNNRYLLDALKNANCDEVILEITGALSPMKVLPTNGDSFLFLVLPVRLKVD